MILKSLGKTWLCGKCPSLMHPPEIPTPPRTMVESVGRNCVMFAGGDLVFCQTFRVTARSLCLYLPQLEEENVVAFVRLEASVKFFLSFIVS